VGKKIFIFPPNSLILADIVERCGHEPLTSQREIGRLVRDPDIDSPPLNITSDQPRKGLKYAAVEVPSGVRGRLAVFGPLVDQAEAAVIIRDPDFAFGCLGCARTNEMLIHLVTRKGIPTIFLDYPRDEEETKHMVWRIVDFLNGLEGDHDKD